MIAEINYKSFYYSRVTLTENTFTEQLYKKGKIANFRKNWDGK